MKFLIVFAVLLLFPLPAFAYLDPASCSAIISALISACVGIGLIIKSYWYKLKALFGKKAEE